MKRRLKPHNDQIILKPLEEGETTSKGGLIIPDSGREKPEWAVVERVGEGIYNYHTDTIIPHKVQVGAIVIIPKMGVQTVSLDGQDYYICQANQLMAEVEEYED